jgi:hypothetical protein
MSWFTTVLDKLKNDFHIPIAVLVFAVTTTVHVWTHTDLGPQYTNSLYALYAFLGGHAFVNKGNSNDSSSGTPPASGS